MKLSPGTPEAEARTPKGEGLKFATQLEWPVKLRDQRAKLWVTPNPETYKMAERGREGRGKGVNPTPTLGQTK